MKQKLKIVLLALGLTALAGCFSGCTTTRTIPETGETVKEFDPVKTEQVKAALEPIGAGAVRRIITNSPQHSEEIANYFRAVGGVFCEMSAKGDFDPKYLIGAVDSATQKLQTKNIPPEAIDAKNAVIALYKINYESRFRAELSPEKWPKNVADLICSSVDVGLKDAGKPGVR